MRTASYAGPQNFRSGKYVPRRFRGPHARLIIAHFWAVFLCSTFFHSRCSFAIGILPFDLFRCLCLCLAFYFFGVNSVVYYRACRHVFSVHLCILVDCSFDTILTSLVMS